MSNEEHAHRWGAWNYAGYETEMRGCDCGATEYRQHQHSWLKVADVFAPVGSGLTIKACTGPAGCGETRRG